MAADTLLSLIEKLEQATGPSRELDACIFSALNGGEPNKYGHAGWVYGPGQDEVEAPFWTASIDAAIPGESIRKVERKRFNNGTIYWIATHDGMGEGLGFVAHAATEPLARRIAALRALLALEDKP